MWWLHNAALAHSGRSVYHYAPFVLCGCIFNVLTRPRTHSESGFSPDEHRIGGKNNCRARSRREITTQRIPILGSPQFAFPGSPAGARLQTIPLGPSYNLGLRLLNIVHPSIQKSQELCLWGVEGRVCGAGVDAGVGWEVSGGWRWREVVLWMDTSYVDPYSFEH